MVGLIEDVLAGDVNPTVANTVCQAGHNILGMIRMKFRYGRSPATTPEKRVLPLAG